MDFSPSFLRHLAGLPGCFDWSLGDLWPRGDLLCCGRFGWFLHRFLPGRFLKDEKIKSINLVKTSDCRGRRKLRPPFWVFCWAFLWEPAVGSPLPPPSVSSSSVSLLFLFAFHLPPCSSSPSLFLNFPERHRHVAGWLENKSLIFVNIIFIWPWIFAARWRGSGRTCRWATPLNSDSSGGSASWLVLSVTTETKRNKLRFSQVSKLVQ